MPQTRNPFIHDVSRLMMDAAGIAQGVRREVDGVVRHQMLRLLDGMDLVRREEFDAVREMAIRARDENDRLAERLAELEAKLADKA
jgi:BMFP domain-containing protein YqiC